jgi:hypothetical protein
LDKIYTKEGKLKDEVKVKNYIKSRLELENSLLETLQNKYNKKLCRDLDKFEKPNSYDVSDPNISALLYESMYELYKES